MRKLVSVVAWATVCIGLCGCYSIRATTVSVTNSSGRDLSNVLLKTGGDQTQPANVKAGETKVIDRGRSLPADVFFTYDYWEGGFRKHTGMQMGLPTFIRSGYHGEVRFTIFSQDIALPDTFPPTNHLRPEDGRIE